MGRSNPGGPAGSGIYREAIVKKDNVKPKGNPLYRAAEDKIGKKKQAGTETPRLSEEEAQMLVHELQVHQAELEIQNEELQQALMELAASTEKYADFYNFTPVGYLTLDEKGHILEANLTGATLLHVEPSWLIGKSFERVVHLESLSTFHFFLKHVFPGPDKQTCELRLLKKGKGPLFVTLEGLAVNAAPDGGKRCRVVMVDITKRRQAEKEMEDFSQSIAHDLREPIRAVDGYARMLVRDLQDNNDEEARRKLSVIREKAKKMNLLIDHIMEFARLGLLNLSDTSIDMESMAKAIWEELREGRPGRSMTLKITPLPGCRGDETLINQALSNLIANAVKFTAGCKTATIEIGGDETADECIYYVKDNGIGFDMRFYDKLFHLFRRLHAEGEYAGTGVGLSVVKRIIERHGGRVWAESAPEEGATFYFSLPRENP